MKKILAAAGLSVLLLRRILRAAPPAPPAADSAKPSWKPQITIYNAPKPEVSTSTIFRSVDPQIIQKLIELLDENNLGKEESGTESPLLDQLKTFVTPEGFALKNRYTRLGVVLAESLGWEGIKHIRVISDQNLKQRLTTVARWDNTPNVRTIALIALARLRDKNDIVYFREAMWSRNIGIRYATLEALRVWGFPEALPILKEVATKDDSYLIRMVAAKILSQLGDPAGLAYLRKGLDEKDWLVRSMAAQGLGEAGTWEDYDTLITQLSREQISNTNDFVLAEICVSALKLYPQKLQHDKEEREKKKRKRLQQGTTQAATAPETSAAQGRQGGGPLFELEPLVVTAPRTKIPQMERVDFRINALLLKMMREKVDLRITQDIAEQSQAYQDLNQLVTPDGIALKTRYTVLGFLLTEGMAGTNDFELLDQLIRVAREGTNPDVRSYALIALAYSKDRSHMGLFQDALRRDTSPQDRFAAVEAMQIWGFQDAISVLIGVSKLDTSPLVRVYASQAVWRMGDLIGKDMLQRSLDDQEWLVRAMAMRYYGELGSGEDYAKLLAYFGSNQPKIVQAEMCSALLRLYGKKMEAEDKR